MRRFFVAAAFVMSAATAGAQTDSTAVIVSDSTQAPVRMNKAISAPGSLPRSGDHFMLQIGYLSWNGAPDSVKTGGLPRSFNAYLMFDFPFKTNPHLSVALGPGIATDNMYFDKGSVEIAGLSSNLVFRDLSDTVHFKKYKLATAYAEVPVELRFSSKPDDSRRSVKAALGIKVGTLLNAHTKGNNLVTSTGGTLNDFKQKEYNKRYLNKQRLSAMARVGIGHWSLFASYQLTPLFRDGLAPTIRPLSIGLTLSGL